MGVETGLINIEFEFTVSWGKLKTEVIFWKFVNNQFQKIRRFISSIFGKPTHRNLLEPRREMLHTVNRISKGLTTHILFIFVFSTQKRTAYTSFLSSGEGYNNNSFSEELLDHNEEPKKKIEDLHLFIYDWKKPFYLKNGSTTIWNC